LNRRRLSGVALAILASSAILVGSSAAQEKPAEPEPYKPVTWKNGLQYRSEDGNLQFRLGGYLQADGWFFLNDQDNLETDSFFIRRARIIMEASFWKRFEFRFMPDFARGSTSIYDAYIDIKFNEAFMLRMGKTKTPVGLERLQSAANLSMVDRAQPTNLVPVRDIGLMAMGTFAHGTTSYMAGIFNGVPDGSNADLDTNDGKDGEARIFALPFKNSASPRLQGLGFGIGGSFGNSVGTPLPVYRTGGLTTYFQYLSTATADGRRARINPAAYYYTGPFGFMTEFVESQQGVSDGITQDDIHNRAYMFTSMWTVSGGNSSFEGVTADHPMGPEEGGRGALQLALRYSALRVDDAAFPIYADPDAAARRAGAWALGVNWIMNYNVRFSFQYEWTKFLGGAAAGADREDENAALLQLQFRL